MTQAEQDAIDRMGVKLDVLTGVINTLSITLALITANLETVRQRSEETRLVVLDPENGILIRTDRLEQREAAREKTVAETTTARWRWADLMVALIAGLVAAGGSWLMR